MEQRLALRCAVVAGSQQDPRVSKNEEQVSADVLQPLSGPDIYGAKRTLMRAPRHRSRTARKQKGEALPHCMGQLGEQYHGCHGEKCPWSPASPSKPPGNTNSITLSLMPEAAETRPHLLLTSMKLYLLLLPVFKVGATRPAPAV